MTASAPPTHGSRIFRSVGLVSLITLCSRILGLAREMVKAALLGTSYFSDAFSLAFAIPNLFRRLTAEGAMTSAFIPIFTEIRSLEGEKQAFDFARNFFWLLSAILTLFSLAFILAAPWLVRVIFAAGLDGEPLTLTVFLTQFMFFYIVLISLAAILQGVLNTAGVFWISALTPVLLNISIIGGALLLAPRLSNPTYGFAAGVILGGTLQLLVQVPGARKLGLHLLAGFNPFDPGIRKALTLFLPTLFGTGIYQLNLIISNIIASSLDEGAISSLNFSNRLLELIIGIFVVSMTTVFLPRFASLFNEQRMAELTSDLRELLELVTFITLPATMGILMIAEETVTLLFARGEFGAESIALTSGALRFHILGLTFIAWNRILLTFFQAGRWLRQTVVAAGIVLGVNTAAALVFAKTAGHIGIAGANSLSQLIQTLLLVSYLHGMLGQGNRGLLSRTRIPGTVAISFMLLAGLWLFRTLLDLSGLPALGVVSVTIAAAVLFYGGLAAVFRRKELKMLLSLMHIKL